MYVCGALHTHGRDDARQQIAGFFYAQNLTYSGSVPPCDVLMDSLPMWCNATGKAEPSFISACNLNFLKMHYTENECATCAQVKSPITAQTIITDILSTDDPENIRETLHEMMLAFFTHYDSPTEEFKERVYCAYRTLYDALKQMETLNPRRAKS